MKRIKIISIFLCLSLLAHSGIVDLLFNDIHNQLKKEVLKELSFLFSNNRIEEVCLNGNYFEKITYTKNGKTIVQFVYDSKENDFVKKTEDYSRKNSSPKQKNNSKVKSNLFCSLLKESHFNTKSIILKADGSFFLKIEKPNLSFFEIHSPPPEFC